MPQDTLLIDVHVHAHVGIDVEDRDVPDPPCTRTTNIIDY